MADFDVKNYAGRRECCMPDGLLNLQILQFNNCCIIYSKKILSS